MSKIKVKPEFAKVHFGFNGSSAALGERDDLHLLLADAKHGNVGYILEMFETVPDDAALLADKEKAFNKKKAAEAKAAKAAKKVSAKQLTEQEHEREEETAQTLAEEREADNEAASHQLTEK